ncbi:uncharacterized protein L201_001437 [Kwoniella dendrophila CBS 6074]|uniref:Amino acid permease/ SLC12A domain-containing protein n=1 Tax=Kwoniella dendrophila CBS 6074 TaxID=1295534 RepID=A0AAX4JMC1_9TREE
MSAAEKDIIQSAYDDKNIGAEVHEQPVDDLEKNVDAAPVINRRHLKGRHITFIGFGSGIGVGLFVGSGAALAKAGPLGLFLAFMFTGCILWSVVQSIGEIATLFPVAGSFPHFAARFIDPAAGFALGWNYFYAYSTAVASELTAASLIISYWSHLSPAVWITVCFVPMIILNFFPVKYFGEAEVITASIKVITFLGLILLGIIIDLGGAPNHDRIGFRYWKDPGAMNHFPGIDGSLGRFLAFFSAFINAAFSYNSTEAVILTAAECRDPTKQIPKAARRVLYRIMFFYMCGSLIIGMTVPYTNKKLLAGTGNAASSPFVIAIEASGIKVLPSIFNAAILTSAWSAGNTYIYVASRTLLGLSLNGQAPRFLQRYTKTGVPWLCVAIPSCFGLLAYLSVGKGGAAQAFTWLVHLNALSGLLSWGTLCVTFIMYHKAMKSQGVSRKQLSWHAPLQPYAAWFGAIACGIIVLFSGFAVFLKGRWNTSTFMANYISIPIYAVPFIGWKIYKKTRFVKSTEADLYTGRITEDEDVGVEDPPTSWYGKLLDKI